ncbi:MAG TPA: D-glycero-beta-D-manno-heptose 1-phosphate adenylyltransferase [Candidatus Kapabacteria bacterium]|nr:D-glycero-beta-D-manno-heptose 1-phosphate adenylyltransferase [Candidatus Kapabacteria bacterium]
MPPLIHSSPVFDFRNEKSRVELRKWRGSLRGLNRPLVFTNGVFDLLHRGHANYLMEARNLGGALLVGVNSDDSVKRLKGDSRPIQSEEDRAYILSMLRSCDGVVIFGEDTPLEVITFVVPDILVKGGDYKIEDIVGREVVECGGGIVKTIPFIEGRSTTGILERMKK